MKESPIWKLRLMWLVAIVVSLAIYVLSMGPVAYLTLHGRLPDQFALPFRPLVWFTSIAPDGFVEALVWYNSMWGV
ncbi:MAG: hypothetical protein V4719_24380 [Planctomycetota bacterium]